MDSITAKSCEFVFQENVPEPLEVTAPVAGAVLNSLVKKFLMRKDKITDPIAKAAVETFVKDKEVTVYIDDIDRGWQGRPVDIRRVSALLNALRDMSSDVKGLRFKIALRADVYFLVRTSDESTDKIQGSVVWYKWNNHEIYVILMKRIGVFFRKPMDDARLIRFSHSELRSLADLVFEERFLGKGHWQNAPMYRVLLSLIRQRPRDLVLLCRGAADYAFARKKDRIGTAELEAYFKAYSEERLQDAINEYKTELPQIERLLMGMKPAKREKVTAVQYQYNTADLLKKIKNVEQGGAFVFAGGRRASQKDLAAFMYKINFITARKELDGGLIDRKYFEESRYLSSEFADFGYDWEIHPAYRWTLQPDRIEAIFESLRLSKVEGID